MSSGIKLTIVALVAFALGFAGARLLPKAKPAENLAWERAGSTVRLTATSPGSGYLILQQGAATSRSVGRGPSKPSLSVDRAMNVQSPIILYELRPFLDCDQWDCNKCDDCSPVPPIPDFFERTQVWLPWRDHVEPEIPARPGD